MHKQELISRLRAFVEEPHRVCPNTDQKVMLAKYLIHYFEELEIPSDVRYDFYRIEKDLTELVIDAFEKLRTGTDESFAHFRREYEKAFEHRVLDILNVGVRDGVSRMLSILPISYLLQEVTGSEKVKDDFEAYCNTQFAAVQQVFDKFLRQVARKGMREMIEECKTAVMAGQFGKTRLETAVGTGRIQFMFLRKRADKVIDAVWFLGDESDPLCLGVHVQNVQTDLHTAIDMIEEVITLWPSTTEERRKVFVAGVQEFV